MQMENCVFKQINNKQLFLCLQYELMLNKQTMLSQCRAERLAKDIAKEAFFINWNKKTLHWLG